MDSNQFQVLQFDNRDAREPVQIIIDAVRKYNIHTLVVLFSGGKDSLVTAMITELAIKKLAEQGVSVQMELLHCYTGTGHPDNFRYVLATADKHNWKLNVEWPADNSEYPQLPYMYFLRDVGFPSRSLHSMIMNILKIKSMERFLQKRLGDDVGIDSQAWRDRVMVSGLWLVSGRGRKNSKRRQRKADKELRVKTEEELTAAIEWSLPFVKPLFNKPKRFVWDFIRQHNLELPESYAFVHHSMECNCGAMAKKGELKEIERWYKDLATDLKILTDQFGGMHEVVDEIGRTYRKDFGRWGWVAEKKFRRLTKEQTQMTEFDRRIEAIACFECANK